MTFKYPQKEATHMASTFSFAQSLQYNKNEGIEVFKIIRNSRSASLQNNYGQ
jgi:hypothetical protein